jgi:hypothetical protein
MGDDELHVVLNFVCILIVISVVSNIYIYSFKPFMSYLILIVLNNLLQPPSVQYRSVRSDMHLIEEL